MTFDEVLKESGMNLKKFCEYFGLPYRTAQNWKAGVRSCPEYLIDLMIYKIRNENIVMEDKEMKINGIGVVSKKEAMSILTKDGIEAVKNGEITTEELGAMYKLELVKKASKIGKYPDTFAANFAKIPESVFDKLSPEEIALLVDNFRDCYLQK